MGDVFSASPAAMEAFSAAHKAAGATILSACSADSEANFAAACAAIGPIGALSFLPAFGSAMHNNLVKGSEVGRLHTAIGEAVDGATADIVAADNA
jgi:hypothetical protein